MNTTSNNWTTNEMKANKPAKENNSILGNKDLEQEEILLHISDKKTKQISRLFESIVLLSIIAILVFASYRLFMNF